jgi:hypothetical protein
MNGDFMKTLVICTTLIMCIVTTVVAITLAEQARGQAEGLRSEIRVQRATIDTQGIMIDKMLSMSEAHQDLIDGILDNEEALLGLVAPKAQTRRTYVKR